MNNYSLIIPIYNEERTLLPLINQLEKFDRNIQILIIDDGSNDATKDILSFNNNFDILRNKKNRGKGYSIRKGIKHSKYEDIILIDGDLEIEISTIPRIINEYEQNNKIPITGIRWIKNDHDNLDINRIGNYLINGIFNIIYTSNYNDVLCCVKIINKSLIQSINLKSNDFSIEVEILAKLTLQNINILEIKVGYVRRSIKEGKKLKLSDAWSILKKIFKIKILNYK